MAAAAPKDHDTPGQEAPLKSLWLKGLWYLAAPGRALKPGAMSGHVIMDEPILIGRAKDGAPFAFHDLCPHRGVHLSDGRCDGETVTCAFHGWRFAPDGACVEIPSLVSGQEADLEKIRLRSFPVREVQGNIWIYIGDSGAAPQTAPFVIPDIGERPYNVATPLIFETDIDNAVFGLLDPAHGAFVHQNAWWRSPGTLQDKEKAFEPEGLGFTMVRHKPSSNSAIYKILGGDRTTEITFRLPGVRLEHIRTGPHHICNLTAITPISATRCQVVNCLYWTQGWLSALKPLAAVMAKRFLTQDQWIVGLQNKTRRYHPPTMLIRDADAQQRWYLQLKRAWSQSRETGAPFKNPVQPQTLRWRT